MLYVHMYTRHNHILFCLFLIYIFRVGYLVATYRIVSLESLWYGRDYEVHNTCLRELPGTNYDERMN